MIVDDHAAFRRMVRTLLQTAGADPVECADGREALARYPEFRPDLVLMDIAMQGLDGLSATAQIKARCPTARIFILTQYDDPDLRAAALQAGAEGYLLKEDLSQLPALVLSLAPAAQSPRTGQSR